MIAWMPGIALRPAAEAPSPGLSDGGYLAAIHAQLDLTAVSRLRGGLFRDASRTEVLHVSREVTKNRFNRTGEA